jgi:hypothetical protein
MDPNITDSLEHIFHVKRIIIIRRRRRRRRRNSQKHMTVPHDPFHTFLMITLNKSSKRKSPYQEPFLGNIAF